MQQGALLHGETMIYIRTVKWKAIIGCIGRHDEFIIAHVKEQGLHDDR